MKPLNLTETIQQALRTAGLLRGQSPAPALRAAAAGAAGAWAKRFPLTGRIWKEAMSQRVADAGAAADDVVDAPAAPRARRSPQADAAQPDGSSRDRGAPGSFTSHSSAAPAGKRAYRLYVPAQAAAKPKPMPLLMMLHGCKQNPDDFATGTRMNALAEQHGCLVVYPAQTSNANGSNCWNWFQQQDQQRGDGEPSILAAIVRDVMAAHDVDPARVFVAGLSAGAAMAVILGRTYPDLFAGVGAHSGLPYAAAHDVASAFNAMRSAAPAVGTTPRKAVPTIVFHGDKDHTVVAANGSSIAAQTLAGSPQDLVEATTSGRATAQSHGFTRTVHADSDGRPQVEHWVVHGAAHAWSGGSQSGSYTDTMGPDASAEMLRFFLAQKSAGV